jgi:hypothetical protein
MTITELWKELNKIPGGYHYMGACSDQICFPLKAGGELRFGWYEDDSPEGVSFGVDLYDGGIPPGVSGSVIKTGC